MCCPIKDDAYTQDDVIKYRTNYSITQHTRDMAHIASLLRNKGLDSNIVKIINDIIFNMVNPIPDNRYKSIEQILPIVDNLLDVIADELLPPPPQELIKKFNIKKYNSKPISNYNMNPIKKNYIQYTPPPLSNNYNINPIKKNYINFKYSPQMKDDLKKRKNIYYDAMREKLKQQKLQKKHNRPKSPVYAPAFTPAQLQRFKNAKYEITI
jgi:hypothetical protein